MSNENLYLVQVYIEPIGKNLLDWYEYEFIFSETPDIVWGNDWEQTCPSICNDLRPDQSTYSLVKHVTCETPLNLAQNNSCFSMQDVIDGILSLAWIFDNEKVLKFKFGEKYEDTISELNKINYNID